MYAQNYIIFYIIAKAINYFEEIYNNRNKKQNIYY